MSKPADSERYENMWNTLKHDMCKNKAFSDIVEHMERLERNQYLQEAYGQPLSTVYLKNIPIPESPYRG
jgi:hypothetical protein